MRERSATRQTQAQSAAATLAQLPLACDHSSLDLPMPDLILLLNLTGRRIIKLGGKRVCHDPPRLFGRLATMTRRDPEKNPAAFLGAELRRARVTAGFSSQEALAASLGFDRSVVAKAETGERPPTAEVLGAWARACQLDEDLFGRLAVLARSADG